MKALKICGKVLLIIMIVLAVIVIIGLLFLKFYPPIGDTPGKDEQQLYAEKTDLYYDKQFHNENDFTVMTGDQDDKSDLTVPEKTIPTDKIESIARASEGELKVTWLGHSTSLIQLGDKNIFIDPVLSERSSPVGFAGPKRFSELALETENVPDIDVLFISHDHYDHLDYNVIKAIDGRVSHYVVPLGIDVILKGWGVDESKLHPLYWWESIELDGITYTLTPAQHYTGRNPLKMNATLWGGLYIKNSDHSIYYTGDTGYYDVFKQVFERFGETELMLADSGQYDNGWAETHMFPEEAVQ
ncbi:MAG: MBL fold metallo-hydrolase, partial [Ruminococcus sp.]|nr:MBL fold metallo-hydrolase [Ruminococcus sp.]